MDIVVTGRNADIHPNFREFVEGKLEKITQFYPRAQRVDVVLTRDRVKDHRRFQYDGVPDPNFDQPITAGIDADLRDAEDWSLRSAQDLKPGEVREEQLGDSPVIVRQKVHEAPPMSVDEALHQMELVGHPFFLFVDKDTMQPCVAYRRKGWTYGILRLNTRVPEGED